MTKETAINKIVQDLYKSYPEAKSDPSLDGLVKSAVLGDVDLEVEVVAELKRNFTTPAPLGHAFGTVLRREWVDKLYLHNGFLGDYISANNKK